MSQYMKKSDNITNKKKSDDNGIELDSSLQVVCQQPDFVSSHSSSTRFSRPASAATIITTPSPLHAPRTFTKYSTDPTTSNDGCMPCEMWCPHCSRSCVTQVEYQSSWVTYLISFFVLLLLGWIAICVLPFLWPILRDAVHLCPRCQNSLLRRSRLSLPSIREDIVTLRAGNCAVVLSRRYVLCLLALLLVICGVMVGKWYVKHVGLPDIDKGELLDDTWTDFLHHCGMRTSLGNPIHSMEYFNGHYVYKQVHWEGRLLKIKEGYWTKNFMFLRMWPSQFPHPEMPDLALMFNNSLNEQVKDLRVGDRLYFFATLVDLGRRGHPHYGVLWKVEKLDESADDFEEAPVALLNMGPLGIMTHMLAQLRASQQSQDAPRITIIHSGAVGPQKFLTKPAGAPVEHTRPFSVTEATDDVRGASSTQTDPSLQSEKNDGEPSTPPTEKAEANVDSTAKSSQQTSAGNES